jgi:hypothetical protein
VLITAGISSDLLTDAVWTNQRKHDSYNWSWMASDHNSINDWGGRRTYTGANDRPVHFGPFQFARSLASWHLADYCFTAASRDQMPFFGINDEHKTGSSACWLDEHFLVRIILSPSLNIW